MIVKLGDKYQDYDVYSGKYALNSDILFTLQEIENGLIRIREEIKYDYALGELITYEAYERFFTKDPVRFVTTDPKTSVIKIKSIDVSLDENEFPILEIQFIFLKTKLAQQVKEDIDRGVLNYILFPRIICSKEKHTIHIIAIDILYNLPQQKKEQRKEVVVEEERKQVEPQKVFIKQDGGDEG